MGERGGISGATNNCPASLLAAFSPPPSEARSVFSREAGSREAAEPLGSDFGRVLYRENGLLNHPIGENKTRHFSRIPPPHCFPLPKGLVAISGSYLRDLLERGEQIFL